MLQLKPFHSALKRAHVDAALRAIAVQNAGSEFDYLRQHGASSLVDRINDIQVPFKRVVDLGAHHGVFAQSLLASSDSKLFRGLSEVQSFTQLCTTGKQAELAGKVRLPGAHIEQKTLVWDSDKLPLDDSSADLVVSSMALHWVNDLPSLLNQVVRALRPEGCFMGIMLGGDTLHELKVAMAFAEQERLGGLGAHISPMLRTANACGLLGNAGLQLVTVDSQRIDVEYSNAFALMRHLWYMGESNATVARTPTASRQSLMAAAAAMQYMFGSPEGCVPITFELVCMIGWKDGAGLAKPLEPTNPGSENYVSFEVLAKEIT